MKASTSSSWLKVLLCSTFAVIVMQEVRISLFSAPVRVTVYVRRRQKQNEDELPRPVSRHVTCSPWPSTCCRRTRACAAGAAMQCDHTDMWHRAEHPTIHPARAVFLLTLPRHSSRSTVCLLSVSLWELKRFRLLRCCPLSTVFASPPLRVALRVPPHPPLIHPSYLVSPPSTPSVIAPSLCTAPHCTTLHHNAPPVWADHATNLASPRWFPRRSGNWATRGDLVKSVAEIRSQRASSLAYVIERMADLEGSIFKMNMEYEGYEDRLKAMLHTLRSYKGDTKKQVEHVSKKVAGLGTLLSRVPQLLEKVESDNRETVEGVTKKISALELMLMHPEDPREGAFRHKKPAAAAAQPSSASSVESEQLGSKISEIGTANVLSMAAAPKSLPGVAAGGVGGVNADALKQARSSPSDLPQTPRDDSPDDRCARRGRRGGVCVHVRAALRRPTHARTHARTHMCVCGGAGGRRLHDTHTIARHPCLEQ